MSRQGDEAAPSPQRWSEVKAVLVGALERAPEDRAAYLDRVCAGSVALRREVESLLAAESAGGFLSRSAIEEVGTTGARAVAGVAGATDLIPRLAVALGARYSIERELGGGGMSHVFVGTERALSRRVVIKLLTPETAADLSLDRFHREIAFAAKLQHANIVPLLSAGEADGLPYYTMPYVEGASLRERLRHGPMDVREVVGVLRDVARALAHAHAHGVVHRDVKPDNILLAGGAAVVTDFGIAKALSAARTAPGLPGEAHADAAITRVGTTLGTPAYMAPEQGAGDVGLDDRADVYALGCTAYELLSGHPPFHGRPTHQLLAAHLAERPVRLSDLRPQVPAALVAIVMRCLEKDPMARPSASELGRALDGVLPGDGAIEDAGRGNWWTRASLRRRATALGALALTIAVGVIVSAAPVGVRSWLTAGDAGIRTVAVLPLSNVGGDTANAFFAAGLADELTNALVQVDGLRVTPPTAVGDATRDGGIQAVAQRLGVAALLDGSVQRDADRMRVRVRLVMGADGRVLWSRTYDRKVEDVFAVQTDIAESVVANLRLTLSGPAQARVARASGTRRVDAYLLYLQGRYAAAGYTEADLRHGIQLHEQAIQLDSTFARAWAGIADAWVSLSGDFVAPATALPPARDAARRALTLDSTLAEAHVALGNVLLSDWDAEGAAASFERAVALERNAPASHYFAASALIPLRRFDEALVHARTAHRLEPLQPAYLTAVALVLLRAGRLDSAVVLARQASQLDTTYSYAATVLGDALRLSGAAAEALDVYATRGPAQTAYDLVGPSLARIALGQPAEARRTIREIGALGARQNAPGDAVAMIHAHLGDRDNAFAWLERAYRARSAALVSLESDADWTPIRADPRFAALVRRLAQR